MKRIVSVILCLLLILSGPAAGAAEEWSYTIGDDGLTLTAYLGSDTAISIPQKIDGKTVVALGENLFLNRALTDVYVPDSITSIAAGAFSGTGLISVKVPKSAAVDNNAFSAETAKITVNLAGDINSDDAVDLVDALFLLRCMNGTLTKSQWESFSLQAANVFDSADSANEVNTADLVRLLQHLTKSPVSLSRSAENVACLSPAKDQSGTPIAFLIQNLRTGGYQTADYQGQRTDDLGRSGQANELYSRARRFRELVKKHDPDVILAQEGTLGWIKWFQEEPYFTSNYTLVHYWESGEETPQGNDSSKPILFKTAKYTLLDSGHINYVDAVAEMGTEVGTSVYTSTWAKLQDKVTGETFYAFSAHIPNQRSNPAATSGIHSLRYFNQLINELPEGAYAFVGGDYNITYRSNHYMNGVDFTAMVDLKDTALNQAYKGLATIGGNSGSVCTLYEKAATGGNYGTPTIQDAPHSNAIDHLFAKPNPHLAVDHWGYDYSTFALPKENVVNGYISDHYALVARVRIGTAVDYSAYQTAY